MRILMKAGCGILIGGSIMLGMVGLKAQGQPAPEAQATAAPVFSEDFESGDLKPEVWTKRVNGDVSVTVQQEIVAHGKNALKAHYPNARGAYAFAVASHLPDSIKGHFFGRAYVNFPNPIPAGHVVFISCGTEGFPISNFFELGNRQNKMQPSYQQNGKDITRGETMFAGPAYPVGKWFCLEWEFNDKPDSMKIWIDGEKVFETDKGYKADTTEDFVKGFSEFAFGFRSWGTVPNGFDVYYDDIAFGTSRIGPVK
jgi:hypothetical protein